MKPKKKNKHGIKFNIMFLLLASVSGQQGSEVNKGVKVISFNYRIFLINLFFTGRDRLFLIGDIDWTRRSWKTPNTANQTQDVREDLTKKKSKFLPPLTKLQPFKKGVRFFAAPTVHVPT